MSTYAPSSFFTYPVSRTVSGLLRRISTEPSNNLKAQMPPGLQPNTSGVPGLYTPPRRHASPFQPPPLTPLSLEGWKESTRERSRLLSRQLAEEIRLLIPPRLQLVETWKLAYSLEQDGVSLATLYKNCEELRGKRGGYVLVIFGAYLSDPPHPDPHFYGTGECFLWRAHVLPGLPPLSSLPPPPSADTTNAQRMTTIVQPKHHLSPPGSNAPSNGGSGASTPERIRFKAFPYSGVNDYMIFCEHGFLSIGGGDGHYGLWLDDNLENGISSSCPTFGNEPLSDEGQKFDVLGVELWFIG
ncbi:hypothetical protein B0J12DRAFT_190720 [Macrophomina phaseolina]|uniref:Oxidation resistance protein 1 n=1 Tax=Macrophomina phaseolina TaxID=35725 RepID=A0ABQ8G3C5_9PEZI|nr:hypothetical protein B0J12DRAFT_190720 [Macrophomina phaseolina]